MGQLVRVRLTPDERCSNNHKQVVFAVQFQVCRRRETLLTGAVALVVQIHGVQRSDSRGTEAAN